MITPGPVLEDSAGDMLVCMEEETLSGFDERRIAGDR